jgi:hypothetical protein
MERFDNKPVIRIFLPCRNAMNDSKCVRAVHAFYKPHGIGEQGLISSVCCVLDIELGKIVGGRCCDGNFCPMRRAKSMPAAATVLASRTGKY